MPFPPGQEQRWSKEFVHARAYVEVCGLNIPHGAVFGVWDPLFFANLCLGGVGGRGAAQTLQTQPAILEDPGAGQASGVSRKSRGSFVNRSANPAQLPASTHFTDCQCPPPEGLLPPGNTFLPSKHASLRPLFPLEKLLLGIVCRAEFCQGSRGNSCTAVTW